jgi:hypothetical protein
MADQTLEDRGRTRLLYGGTFLTALMLVFQACQGNADFSDAMPAPVVLSAEAYRAEILRIDRLVFEAEPFTSQSRENLAESLKHLSRRVKAESDSRFLAIEALEIRRLAEFAGDLAASSPPRSLTDNWMRIRNNLFEDQAWFARSACDLEPRGVQGVTK